jgi:penicillin-binding protein activator
MLYLGAYSDQEEDFMRSVTKKLLFIVLPLMVIGCSNKVTRVQSDSVIDLSGRWNDVDSRLVAEQMINDCLNKPWIYKWQSANKLPTVIVGKIVNKTLEHISVETFVKDVEAALLNSGKVTFVATKTEREQVRDEKEDMQGNASVQTAKSMGEESGADLMMIGTLNAVPDQEGNEAVVFYQVNMELVDIESNQKVWIGTKKIKKFVERATKKF